MEMLRAHNRGEIVRSVRVVWGDETLHVEALLPGTPVPDREALFLISSFAANTPPGSFLTVRPEGAVLRKETTQEFTVWHPGILSSARHWIRWQPLHIGVLTVSDKGSRGERVDTAGPTLERASRCLGGDVVVRQIVPDDIEIIASTVTAWTIQKQCHLILITGGTGLSPRDRTPESLEKLTSFPIPGLGETMRRLTAEKTDRAPLSRGGAVLCEKTLIIAFPGSERGARECFESVAPVLRHAVEIAQGWEGECGGHGHHFHAIQ